MFYIPNIKAFNSIIKGHFSGGDNQNIKIPEIALGVACMATLVGDQDDSSENDEDIEELDNEVITESPEGDESDVIENNVSYLEDEDEGGNDEFVFMYRVDSHDCGQTKLGPILQKFRNSLKMKMGENFKNKFHNVFAKEKKALLNTYKDDPDLLERII